MLLKKAPGKKAILGGFEEVTAYCPNNQTTIFDALNEAGC
jgi:hypothetical protein